MSTDYKSGLPIRSEIDGLDERVHVKVVGNPTGAAGIATNQQAVDDDKNAHVEMHGNDPLSVDRIMRLSELGAVTPDGVYDATNNTKPGNGGIIVHARAVTPGDSDQTIRATGINSTANTNVWAQDVAIRDENGNPYTETNPLPVTFTDSEGSEINDYNESAVDVAKDASDTHIYTAAADMKFTQVSCAAPGRANFLIEVDPTNSGTYTKKFKLFVTTSDGNASLTLREPIAISATGKIRITRTNRDNQAFTLYSTISGHTTT